MQLKNKTSGKQNQAHNNVNFITINSGKNNLLVGTAQHTGGPVGASVITLNSGSVLFVREGQILDYSATVKAVTGSWYYVDDTNMGGVTL